MSVDILGRSWDQCINMVQYCFTSTETIRLVRTESPGRPPRLSHSFWALTRSFLFWLLLLGSFFSHDLSYPALRFCRFTFSLALIVWSFLLIDPFGDVGQVCHSLWQGDFNRKQVVNRLKIPQCLSTLLFRRWSSLKGRSPRWFTVRNTTCFTKRTPNPQPCGCVILVTGLILSPPSVFRVFLRPSIKLFFSAVRLFWAFQSSFLVFVCGIVYPVGNISLTFSYFQGRLFLSVSLYSIFMRAIHLSFFRAPNDIMFLGVPLSSSPSLWLCSFCHFLRLFFLLCVPFKCFFVDFVPQKLFLMVSFSMALRWDPFCSVSLPLGFFLDFVLPRCCW